MKISLIYKIIILFVVVMSAASCRQCYRCDCLITPVKDTGLACKDIGGGLTVKDGLFIKDGKPYRGIGINYFTALTRTTGIEGMPAKLSECSYRKGFEVLREYEIPFVRFGAGGFYPSDWQLYLTDKHSYFKAFDRLVADAEDYGIGLIPTLFWYYPTMPDIKDEHTGELGNPESGTLRLIRQYTREVVTRYRDSSAVWAWEFGNEYIHEADLPQPELGRGWVVPELGTPKTRTLEDKLYRKDIYVAYKAFVDTIRMLDKSRPIISGDTMPRFSAYNNHNFASWQVDSPQQWQEMLIKDNQFMDTISIHFYFYDETSQNQDGGIKGWSPDKQMKFMMDTSRQISKPLFIGEFGASNRKKPTEQEKIEFEAVLGLIMENEVPLAALWNFDLVHEDQTIWNVQADNERKYMLEALRDANRSIRGGKK